MKSAFRGYYPPTESELDQLWSDGLVILDTNALLNLFRYTEETRIAFLKLLDEKADALWIPYQVGLEFHRRRIDVINTQAKAFTDIDSALTSAQSSVQSAINKFKRHPSLDPAGLSELLESSIKTIADGLATAKANHASAVVEKQTNEQTFAKITHLYEGKVGEPFSTARLEEVYKDGSSRYEKKRPPGFKDQGKDGNDKYGDLVLWMQILEKAAAEKKPAIFITDDAKEDWWYIVDGKTQGPRVELVDEYYAASEKRIHFYSPDRFLAFAQERGSSISDESVVEVEKVSTAGSIVYRAASGWALAEERIHLLNRLAHAQELHEIDPSRQGGLFDTYVRSSLNKLRKREQRLETIDEGMRAAESVIKNSKDFGATSEAIDRLRDLADERARLMTKVNDAQREWVASRNRDPHSHTQGADYNQIQRRLRSIEKALEDVSFNVEQDEEN